MKVFVDALNCESNQYQEEIYTDFNFTELFHESESVTESAAVNAFAQVNGGRKWGYYNKKPKEQTRWEKTVQSEINKIMTEDGENFPYMKLNSCRSTQGNEDQRPHLWDPLAKYAQLVDTGAVICVWPKADYPDAVCNPHMLLEAVNGSRLSTFGTRTRTVKIGRKAYKQEFVLADIKSPILGWDFIKGHKVSLIWADEDEEQMDLVDKKANIKARLRLGPAERPDLLGLKVVASVVAEQKGKIL